MARRRGDADTAIAGLLAILERDPYDEDAHRALVATLVGAGRHGEARRAHARYCEAMRTIGVAPPDDVLLNGGAATRAPSRGW
ncbi:MAG: BTAD domain-containing putative transcriptional regulator [Micromonosporaceae bacterium]